MISADNDSDSDELTFSCCCCCVSSFCCSSSGIGVFGGVVGGVGGGVSFVVVGFISAATSVVVDD